jgi:hypothetical protein
MNCKLGGQLWKVDIPLTNTMVLGMDIQSKKNEEEEEKRRGEERLSKQRRREEKENI